MTQLRRWRRSTPSLLRTSGIFCRRRLLTRACKSAEIAACVCVDNVPREGMDNIFEINRSPEFLEWTQNQLGMRDLQMDARQGAFKKVTILFLSPDPSTSAGWRSVTVARLGVNQTGQE